MNTTTLTFIPFPLWLKANGGREEIEKESEDCPDCDGTGDLSCPCCGNTDTCGVCNGHGKKPSAEQIYQQQREADQKRLEKYQKMIEASQ